ncbi:hypothetical protein Vafri_17536 [Volvox africanus]|uniref:Uncharacterized protein n=1 Tax=Volvox africanus TaxID=51714 RepID=A0A8J4BKU3_9CHLO|nr:hypothetical protein Vafri_17536 [Volvox africanus]
MWVCRGEEGAMVSETQPTEEQRNTTEPFMGTELLPYSRPLVLVYSQSGPSTGFTQDHADWAREAFQHCNPNLATGGLTDGQMGGGVQYINREGQKGERRASSDNVSGSGYEVKTSCSFAGLAWCCANDLLARSRSTTWRSVKR